MRQKHVMPSFATMVQGKAWVLYRAVDRVTGSVISDLMSVVCKDGSPVDDVEYRFYCAADRSLETVVTTYGKEVRDA